MTDQTKIISITLSGPFEAEDLAGLVAWFRAVDIKHPDRTYFLVINDPDATLGEAEQALRDAMPPVPGRQTEFLVLKKNDDDRTRTAPNAARNPPDADRPNEDAR